MGDTVEATCSFEAVNGFGQLTDTEDIMIHGRQLLVWSKVQMRSTRFNASFFSLLKPTGSYSPSA